MDAGLIFSYIVLALLSPVVACAVVEVLFHPKWTCRVFGWHNGWHKTNSKHQQKMTLNGINIHSVCWKCGKRVMMDGQGNWF